MAKEALVVEKKILFDKGEFSGFIPSSMADFTKIILENYKYHLRGEKLENNSDLQQIIPYVWIVNPEKKEVFAYRRAADKNYSEARLRNKWSCGLGGHIERTDAENPIEKAMMRELKEEVKMQDYPLPKILGYIKISGGVNDVHFGIVAIVETTNNVEKGDEEMAEGRFFTIPELERLFTDSNVEVEEWTTASWPYIKRYLKAG